MPVYNYFKAEVMKGTFNLHTAGDTIKVALAQSGYTPDIDTHDFFDDITNEVSGGNYTAGGATLANQAVSQDNTDDEGVFDGDDVEWAASTITARYAIIYKSTGTASTSPLIAYIDFAADKSSDNGSFKITWDAEGILNLG